MNERAPKCGINPQAVVLNAAHSALRHVLNVIEPADGRGYALAVLRTCGTDIDLLPN
jgi:hypothetical protein